MLVVIDYQSRPKFCEISLIAINQDGTTLQSIPDGCYVLATSQ